MKALIPILIIVISFIVVVSPAYSQAIVCHDQIVIWILQVDGMIECLDKRITSTESRITVIENNPPSGGVDDLIGQSGGSVYLSITKTNIGTSYVVIYSTIFDEENQLDIDLRNATYVRAVFLWDYVGTGNHQVRWTPANATTTSILESVTFNTDCNPCTTAWTLIPSSVAERSIIFNWMGKSDVGTDDPIARGFQIQTK